MTFRRNPEHQGGVNVRKKFPVIAGLTFAAAAVACKADIQPTPTSDTFSIEPQVTEIIQTPIPDLIDSSSTNYFSQEAVTLLLGLGEGHVLKAIGEHFEVINNSGERVVRIPQEGLTQEVLENGRRIYKGIEIERYSQVDQQFPKGYELVLDQLGQLSVLGEGRIAGVFHEGEMLMMPGLNRWGASELQVNGGFQPTVTSLHGTELYKYLDGEWRSAIHPNMSTYFVRNGATVMTGDFKVENTPIVARRNVGEFDKNVQTIVMFDNPEPYMDDTYGRMVVEGVILSPDGAPSIVRVPILPDDNGVIRYAAKNDMTGGALAGNQISSNELRELSVENYVRKLGEKVYAYALLEFGLIESKIHPEYRNHPLYQNYREAKSSGALDFLENPNMPSPYIIPLEVMSLTLDGY